MFNKILLAVDGSEESKLAEDYAIYLAKKSSATITVINVIDITPYIGMDVGGGIFGPHVSNISELIDIRKKESGKILNDFKEKAQKENISVQILIETGVPWNKIIEESENYDLIVIGSRGLTGIERMLIGSTAERVVRNAKCPVLVVKKNKNKK